MGWCWGVLDGFLTFMSGAWRACEARYVRWKGICLESII